MAATNHAYSPLVEICNPTENVLQITQIFTTGVLGFPYNSFVPVQLQPYESSGIIKLSFNSQTPASYRGVVNFVTDRDLLLTLPVEIDFFENGLYPNPSEINFGIIHSPFQSHERELRILNAFTYPVEILSISLFSHDSQVTIKFRPTLIQAGINKSIAKFTFTPSEEGSNFGSFVLKTNDTNNPVIEVNYYAYAIFGALDYSKQDTTFFTKKVPTPEIRTISLINKFAFPLVIYNVESTLESFRVVSIDDDILVQPHQVWNGLLVQFVQTPVQIATQTLPGNSIIMLFSDGHSHGDLRISTNVSTIIVPLQSCNGKLSYHVLDQVDKKRIDFGILALNEVGTRRFNLTNTNPTQVQVISVTSTLSRLDIELESIYDRTGFAISTSHIITGSNKFHTIPSSAVNPATASTTPLTSSPSVHQNSFRFVLDERQSAIFRLHISCSQEETGQGYVQIQFNDKEILEIPVAYQSMKGTLNLLPVQLQFSAFPGRVIQKSITAKSTYSKPITIQSISSTDSRIIPTINNYTLLPNTRTEIATILFDPSQGATDENYMSPVPASVLQQSKGRITDLEIKLLNQRDYIWNRLVAAGKDSIEGNLVISTDIASGHTLSFKAPLLRPSIIKESVIDFSLTQIGSSSRAMLPIVNPSDSLIQVELIYQLPENAEFQLPPLDEQPYLIPPRTTTSIGPIYFLPQLFHHTNLTIQLRNNLTIVQTVLIQGQGGSGIFTFISNQTESPVTESSETSFSLLTEDCLLFQFHSDQLEKCKNQSVDNIIITKSFTATNIGNLPVDVYALSINNAGCKRYGFQIHDCEPFTLKPNETTEIQISFSPDFSASIVKRSLVVSTSHGDISFNVEGHIPYEWLSVCSEAQHLSPLQQSFRLVAVVIFSAIFSFCVFHILYDYYHYRNHVPVEYSILPISVPSDQDKLPVKKLVKKRSNHLTIDYSPLHNPLLDGFKDKFNVPKTNKLKPGLDIKNLNLNKHQNGKIDKDPKNTNTTPVTTGDKKPIKVVTLGAGASTGVKKLKNQNSRGLANPTPPSNPPPPSIPKDLPSPIPSPSPSPSPPPLVVTPPPVDPPKSDNIKQEQVPQNNAKESTNKSPAVTPPSTPISKSPVIKPNNPPTTELDSLPPLNPAPAPAPADPAPKPVETAKPAVENNKEESPKRLAEVKEESLPVSDPSDKKDNQKQDEVASTPSKAENADSQKPSGAKPPTTKKHPQKPVEPKPSNQVELVHSNQKPEAKTPAPPLHKPVQKPNPTKTNPQKPVQQKPPAAVQLPQPPPPSSTKNPPSHLLKPNTQPKNNPPPQPSQVPPSEPALPPNPAPKTPVQPSPLPSDDKRKSQHQEKPSQQPTHTKNPPQPQPQPPKSNPLPPTQQPTPSNPPTSLKSTQPQKPSPVPKTKENKTIEPVVSNDAKLPVTKIKNNKPARNEPQNKKQNSKVPTNLKGQETNQGNNGPTARPINKKFVDGHSHGYPPVKKYVVKDSQNQLHNASPISLLEAPPSNQIPIEALVHDPKALPVLPLVGPQPPSNYPQPLLPTPVLMKPDPIIPGPGHMPRQMGGGYRIPMPNPVTSYVNHHISLHNSTDHALTPARSPQSSELVDENSRFVKHKRSRSNSDPNGNKKNSNSSSNVSSEFNEEPNDTQIGISFMNTDGDSMVRSEELRKSPSAGVIGQAASSLRSQYSGGTMDIWENRERAFAPPNSISHLSSLFSDESSLFANPSPFFFPDRHTSLFSNDNPTPQPPVQLYSTPPRQEDSDSHQPVYQLF